MDTNPLKFHLSCNLWTVELKPSDFNSITVFINLPPPNVQNPHHGFLEKAKPNLNCLKSLRQKIGRLMSCCKALEVSEPTESGDHPCYLSKKLEFQSRTSAIERDEKIREAIRYCKSTFTSDHSKDEAKPQESSDASLIKMN